MTNRFISNISQDVNRVLLGLKSRIAPFHSRISSDSILSRICLASLIWLFLILGGFSVRAWGETVSSANSGDDVKNNKIVMTNSDHVSFTFAMDDYDISNAGWPTYQYFLGKFSGKKYGTFTWSVDAGYAVKVTNIAFKLRGYSSAAWDSDDLEATFNGTNKEIGTNGTGLTSFSESNASGFTSGVQIEFDNQLDAKYPKEFYIKEITITYTVATIYSVRFNGNGNTGGSMSNQAFVYGTAQNLTANAFTRSYSVKYDEAGGSAVSDAVANYTFAGWATSAGGDVVYANQASVNNLTTTPNGVYDIYAKWNSASVTLPSAPTKAESNFDGWYIGETRIGGAGGGFTPTSDTTITARWSSKYTPIFTFTGSKTTLNVDEVLPNAFSFEHVVDSAASYRVISISAINNGSGKVIEYDRKTNSITAVNAGVAKLVIDQADNDTISAGHSDSVTITVNKYVTTLDGLVTPMLVDATPQIGSYVATNTSASNPSEGTSNDFYYTITDVALHTPTVVTGCAEGHEADVIGYTPSTQTITAYNAGTAKLTIAQKETYKYAGDTLEMNISASKYTPVYTWDNDVETNYTFEYLFNSVKHDIFSTSSAEDVPYTIVSNNEYAANVIGDSLMVYNVREDAVITVSQQETYKWNAHEKTYTIHPVKADNHVPFTFNGALCNDGTITTKSEAYWWTTDEPYHIAFNEDKDTYVVIKIEGVPDSLSFYYKTKGGSIKNFDIYESTTNEFAGSAIWSTTTNYTSDWSPLQRVPLQPTTRYVKIFYHGSKLGRLKDLRFTEKYLFETDPKDLLDFGLQGQNYGQQVKTVNFNHANAGRLTNIVIEGADADKYAVTPTEIPGTGRDIASAATLRVTFDNKKTNRESTREADEPYVAKLVITDNNGHRDTVNLTGRRHGKSYPQFTFNPNHVPYYFGTTIHKPVVSTNMDVNARITLTSSNNSIAEIVDGTLVIKNTGAEVTITVHQDASGDFREYTETFKFTPRAVPPLRVPFMMTETIAKTSSMVTMGEDCSWTDDGYIRSGWSDWQATASGRYFDSKKEFVVKFGGTPDKLSFIAKNTYASIKCRWKVEESSDSINWTPVFYKEESCKSDTRYSNIKLNSGTQFLRFQYGGNYTGYFKDINVTCIDGIKYMLTSDGKYLSRGGAWGTQAIVDEFGLPVLVSRYTADNTNYVTEVEYLDSRQYLYEAGDNKVFTDNEVAGSTQTKWKQILADGKVTVQSANGGDKFITVDEDGNLKMIDAPQDATAWEVEDYTLHASRIQTKLDQKAAAAAMRDFGTEVNTMAKVRTMLETEEFDETPMVLAAKAISEQKGDYHASTGTNPVYDVIVDTLKPGFYRLTVQALYRPAPSQIAWENHENDYESVVGYAYANDFHYPIKSVFDTTGRHSVLVTGDTLCGGYYYPANLSSATAAFDGGENKYLHDLYVYVPADEGKTTGTLRYGIKNPSYVPGVWLAYGNFTLTRIARQEFIFNGGDVENPDSWDDNDNWNKGSQPDEHNIAIIQADLTITEEVKAYELRIENDAIVTIAPTGGLKIGAGGIRGAVKDTLVLKAGTTGATKGQTGYLRISPDCVGEMPEATIELYSTGYYNKGAEGENIAAWQLVGCPIDFEGKLAKTVFTRSWIYSYREATDSWVNDRKTLVMEAFTGYKTTQYDSEDGMLLTFTGKLIPNKGLYTVNLDYTDSDHGHNIVANSFMAPIDITQFNDTDFVNAEKTIYIYNTGSKSEGGGTIGNSPGQWTAISIGTVEEMNEFFSDNPSIASTIAPMQGFCVNATGADAKLKFDYSRLVWNANYSEHPNQPLRASKRVDADDAITGAMKITIEADGLKDEVYMLESERYSLEYEDGYDAHKLESGEFNIFTVHNGEKLAIDATPDFVGTEIGVRTGEETAYSITFSNVYGEAELALVDMETDEVINISEGMQYTFFAEPNAVISDRFMIVEGDNVPAITTGVDNVENGAKVHKFIKDNQLFILKDGVLYNAFGAVVR